MKKIIKSGLFLVSGIMLLASCQKEELNREEGLMSKTGNQELVDDSAGDELLQTEVVLHMQYSKDLTAEEAEAEWNKDVANFEMPSNLKAYSTEWFFRVRTHTGPQTNNGTDGRVECKIRFTTNIGGYITGRYNLNNAGNDREEGDWDFYLVRTYIANRAISWLEVDYAYLYLQGTDGWFPTDFDVYATPYYQSIPATGGTYIFSAPNVWLDNNSSTGWDTYYTGNIGYGRLRF